ncbi:MAG: zf-HC2 domain-containing protein [Cyanobacteria bacterium SIG28]|nr:zf-HC2 domain-containing protein [Cyanobacteria bacterium SIG28]
MNLTCTQMDVLISFYIENDLSNNLKQQVEEHLRVCPACRAKYDIIKSMLTDLKEALECNDEGIIKETSQTKNSMLTSQHYKLFQTNLSAYIDNELPNEENVKIKKFTINNNLARKELENSYNIRKLMNDSFKKTKNEARQDFSKNIIKQLELEEEATLGIHPAIKLVITFTITVLIVTGFILMFFTA